MSVMMTTLRLLSVANHLDQSRGHLEGAHRRDPWQEEVKCLSPAVERDRTDRADRSRVDGTWVGAPAGGPDDDVNANLTLTASPRR